MQDQKIFDKFSYVITLAKVMNLVFDEFIFMRWNPEQTKFEFDRLTQVDDKLWDS